jgi:8-oxo-dGTP diphosphatase
VRQVQVVAAVICRAGRILITRRHGHAERGGQWEFPGGKVEPGESEKGALRREILEELGCDVAVGRLLARTEHRYPDLAVDLAFFACEIPAGTEPRLIGAAAMDWADPAQLAEYDFCEADRPILTVLVGPSGV